MQRRLERSTTNRVITGVCGGLAEYLAIDATLVRVFFVIATIFTAFLFLLVYIVLLILMPLPGQRPPIDDIWPSARTGEVPAMTEAGVAGGTAGATEGAAAGATAGATAGARAPLNGRDVDRRRQTIGYVLLALGFVFLIGNLGGFRFIQWQLVWPLALIALGVLLLVQRTRP